MKKNEKRKVKEKYEGKRKRRRILWSCTIILNTEITLISVNVEKKREENEFKYCKEINNAINDEPF